MIAEAMLLGAGAGLGVMLLAYGLRPPRPALARALAALRHPPARRGSRREQLLGAPLARLGLPGRQIRQDLALLQRPVEGFRAVQVAATGLGAAMAATAAILWGGRPTVPALLVLGGAVAGYRWAAGRVRAAAAERRDELRQVLSVMQDLMAVAMAGGAGIDQATQDAAAICTGPAAERLRRTLAQAQLTRTPAWQALATLGEQTAVDELTELAHTIQLAGGEGARVRTALGAYAAAMRGRQIAELETAARAAGVRMAMPVLVLALGYGLFLLYPALSAMQTGL